MHLHGLTRSKELVDIFHRVGVCIGYSSVLVLRDAWAVHDLQLCSDCPDEIAEGKPGVIVVDNDDFKNDTLTGGNTSHRTMSSQSPLKIMVFSVVNVLKMLKPYQQP